MVSVADAAAVINQFLPEPHAGLLAGIVFGTKAALSQDLKNALQTTGTLHIVALSGMNITILTGIFFSTFVLVLPRWISSILAIGVIAVFVWFVGPSPSVVRAAIMGCITLLTALTGYVAVALLTWGLACLSMLLFQPAWIGDLSFQLSALASLGMILFGTYKIHWHTWRVLYSETAEMTYRPVYRLWIYLRHVIQAELVTTLSAQVFTMPLILVSFGRISLISPLTNLLIGWTIPIITVLGLCMSAVGKVTPFFGQLIGWITWVFLEWLIRTVMATSAIPFASIGR